MEYVKALIDKNYTTKQIAERVGRHPNSVKGFLQRRGWKAKPVGLSPLANVVTREERDRIASKFSGASYQDDMSMRSAIAVEAGRSESVTRSVCNWIHGRPVCSTSKIYNDPVPKHLGPAPFQQPDDKDAAGDLQRDNRTLIMALAGKLGVLDGRLSALQRDLGVDDDHVMMQPWRPDGA
jgi:hypothetical protein